MPRPGYPKESSDFQTVTNHYHLWRPVEQSYLVTDGTTSHFASKEFETAEGSNTPGWPFAIRDNDYLHSRFTQRNKSLSVEGMNSFNNDKVSGEWAISRSDGNFDVWAPGSVFGLTDEVILCKQHMINKLIDKIQSHRINLGEIYATRNQLASSVARTANRLAGAVLALRRGNVSGAIKQLTGSRFAKTRTQRVAGGIPEQWLALQYGWLPLVEDIYNGCETMKRALDKDIPHLTVKASSHIRGKHIVHVQMGSDSFSPDRRFESAGQPSVRGNASIKFRVSDLPSATLSQLGITNPLSLAWELLPWSFVLDWMYPVGSYLERLDYSRGLVFVHGHLSYHVRANVTMRLENATKQSGFWTLNWSGGQGNADAFIFVREALGSFPSVPPPRVKDPFSLTHVANGLSLLATAFGRKK